MVRGRKAGRPGLCRLPSGDLLRGAARGCLCAGGPAGSADQLGARGGDAAFSLGNCWECFSPTRVPSCWLTSASHSRLRSSPPSLLRPSIELPEPQPLGGPGRPECSQPPSLGASLPSGVTRPATLLEPVPPGPSPQNWEPGLQGQPRSKTPCWCAWEGHPLRPRVGSGTCVRPRDSPGSSLAAAKAGGSAVSIRCKTAPCDWYQGGSGQSWPGLPLGLMRSLPARNLWSLSARGSLGLGVP